MTFHPDHTFFLSQPTPETVKEIISMTNLEYIKTLNSADMLLIFRHICPPFFQHNTPTCPADTNRLANPNVNPCETCWIELPQRSKHPYRRRLEKLFQHPVHTDAKNPVHLKGKNKHEHRTRIERSIRRSMRHCHAARRHDPHNRNHHKGT